MVKEGKMMASQICQLRGVSVYPCQLQQVGFFVIYWLTDVRKE